MNHQNRLILISTIVIVAAMSRLLPHPYNFTPIGGLALFGAGLFGRNKLGWIVPLVALFVSDIVINHVVLPMQFADIQPLEIWKGAIWIYGSFGLIYLFGRKVMKNVSPRKAILAGVGSGVIFYLLTNFGVWLTSGMYPMSAGGLMMCYGAGLPFASAEMAPPFGFLANGIFGDVFYTLVLYTAAKAFQIFPPGTPIRVKS